MIVDLKCYIKGCQSPVKYHSYGIDMCESHGLEMMRCESNFTGPAGDCLFCMAAQGESCRKK